MRGAAPWAARHAGRHAAEARARHAEPPRPGSARATLRVPDSAETIKARVAELISIVTKVRSLRRQLERTFFEVGELLTRVERERLFEAKGYLSFEAFVERETDLGKKTAAELVRIAATFRRDAAERHGLVPLAAALRALDDIESREGTHPKPPLPLKPPSKG
jgi:hypothetical protein